MFHETNGWFYTDWQVQSLDVTANAGHTLSLTLLGSDCPYGGHAGYVYLDGFGAIIPPVNPVPEPASAVLMALSLGGLAVLKFRRKK